MVGDLPGGLTRESPRMHVRVDPGGCVNTPGAWRTTRLGGALVAQRTCSVDTCDSPHYGHGRCNRHWQQWRKHGGKPVPRLPRTCVIDGCEQAHWARGWCKRHWARWHRNGDPNVWGRDAAARAVSVDRPCKVEACSRPVTTRGLCQLHYARWHTHRDTSVVGTRLIDLTGRVFGRLTVLGRDQGSTRPIRWHVRCECGTATTVQGDHLRIGHTRSCGCLRRASKPGGPALGRVLDYYRRNARDRGVSFALSAEEFAALARGRCAYCGAEPALVTKVRGQVFVGNGVDRVNNDLGYEPGNVAPCCTLCNRMKGALTTDLFLRHVSRIAGHRDA